MKQLHLKVSIFVIVSISLIYGITPDKTLPLLFDFTIVTTDLKNIFRATMGLYLGIVVFWTIGIMQPKFWAAATITNICFMGGLATGRLMSILIDGQPSIYFLVGFIVEVIFTFWGLINLKRHTDYLKME